MQNQRPRTLAAWPLLGVLVLLFSYTSCSTPPSPSDAASTEEITLPDGLFRDVLSQDASNTDLTSSQDTLQPDTASSDKPSNSTDKPSHQDASVKPDLSVEISDEPTTLDTFSPQEEPTNSEKPINPDTREVSEESPSPDTREVLEDSPSPDTTIIPEEPGTVETPMADQSSSPDKTTTPETVTPETGPQLYTRKVVGDGKPLATIGPSGRLVYRRYASEGQTNRVHILPDFSYAGYKRGGVPLPAVPTRLTLSPVAGDSRARIQSAIDTVSNRKPDAQGFRGAVMLKKGTYYVGDTVRIRASGVVLRGEGQGKSGTVLIATKRSQHDLIQIAGTGNGLGEVSKTRVRISSSVVPVGSTSFEVTSTSVFSVGDPIAVLRTPNQKWLTTLGMNKYGWTTSAYTIAHERRITAIKGNTIFIDIPIVDAIETTYGGGSIYKTNIVGRISQCGVEDMRLVSQYSGKTDEKHAWTGIKLSRAINSWVRRVTVRYFGYTAVGIASQSSFNTVEEVAMLDPISQITGGRRYPFYVSGGVGNLIQRCFARGGRHNFVAHARITGPHVWLDCLGIQNYSDDGPHHRWATGLLFDNTSSKALNVQNRTSSGTGHGWAGAQVLFWNAVASTMICDAPKAAMNWAIGCVGKKSQGTWASNEPFGWWESEGKPVKPRSLYLQQLADRLGSKAVTNITMPAQRKGRIWSRLSVWAGEGRLDQVSVVGDPGCKTGIISGSACCAASCKTCGGSGCSQRLGGAVACCTGTIKNSGRSCTTNKPPCTLP